MKTEHELAAEAHYFIRVNGQKLYLEDPGKNGTLCRPFDGFSEQCEDCAKDIAETCLVYLDNFVRCECGCLYPIEKAR